MMLSFLFRRLLHAIPTLLGITLLLFVLFHMVGGNPVYRMLGKNANPAEIARITHQLGLDRPLWHQYLDYIRSLARLDFGRSWETRQRVSEMILDGLWPSLSLAIPAFILSTLASLAVALTAALYRNRWQDRLLVVLSVCGMSLSMLAFIIGAQYLFAFRAGWFPISGWEPGIAGLPFLALPILIWMAASIGASVRFYRAVFTEEMRREYVVTARAKGLAEKNVVWRHVTSNALIPVITVVGLELGTLLSGSIIVETVFAWPGSGSLLITALNARDYPLVTGLVMTYTTAFVTINLIIDGLYAIVDPRIRY